MAKAVKVDPKRSQKNGKEKNQGIFSMLMEAAYNGVKAVKESSSNNLQRTINESERLAKDGVFNDILDKRLQRTITQMENWRLGLSMWEDSDSPDRSYMHQIYQEIALDGQVAAKMGIAVNRIEASEFLFVDPMTGQEDKELTLKFRKEWFGKFLRESLYSDYYGYTLFQFPEMDAPFSFDSNRLEVVPRHLVLPNVKTGNPPRRDGLVIPNMGSNSGVSFKYGKYSHRCLGIGEEDSLGMFSAIAPLFIYKKNALSFWSGYQQRYGEPTIVINMKTWNKDNHSKYQDFLKHRGVNSGLITRNEDEAQLLENNRNDAYQIYLQMISYCDSSISKIMEGNTATSDAGGSKNTGETHAKIGDLYHLGRLKRLAYHVNDHLVPFLEKEFGLNLNGKVFRWKEFKDVDAEVDNIMKLSTNFKMEAEEVLKRTGYIVTKQKEENEVDNRAGNRKKSPDKDDNTAKKRN